jgi:hypothetical protein
MGGSPRAEDDGTGWNFGSTGGDGFGARHRGGGGARLTESRGGGGSRWPRARARGGAGVK